MGNDVQISVVLGKENDHYWASVEEIGVHVEAETAKDLLVEVLEASREMLLFLRDERENLSEELAGGAKYVGLLEEMTP